MDDCCTYKSFICEAPANCREIRIHFSYSPYIVGEFRNLISLALFDPLVFRGWVYPFEDGRDLIISSQTASDGFISNPITEGEWNLFVAIPALISEEPCTLTLEVEFVLAGVSDSLAKKLEFQNCLSDKSGWYRGELHTHTVHSDGQWKGAELVEAAKERGLDFLMVTDHNTISGWEDVLTTAKDDILIVPGVEITSFYGHALALGVEHWIDCRIGWEEWTMNDAALAVREERGCFLVAHPLAEGRPYCAGCRWEYPEFDMSLADGIEVWNALWTDVTLNNDQSLLLWEDYRKKGYKLTATSGCDVHDADAWKDGTPYSFVYSETLSRKEIIEGIRDGKVVISSGPWLNIKSAEGVDTKPTIIGDTLIVEKDKLVLVVQYDNVLTESWLVLKKNFQELVRILVVGSGQIEREIPIYETAQITVELRTSDNTLLALTNPVHALVQG